MGHLFQRIEMKLIRRKLHEVEVALKPLSFGEMMEVNHLINDSENLKALMEGAVKVLKISLKEAKGLKNIDGEDIVLEFENDELTNECINELVNCQICGLLASAATTLAQGASNLDLIPGVEKLGKKKSPKKK